MHNIGVAVMPSSRGIGSRAKQGFAWVDGARDPVFANAKTCVADIK